jgi:hypothetical protein
MTGPSPLLVDADGACALLGGISKKQLGRIVESGRLAVVRLPGARNRHGHGTTDPIRRVLYSVEDLRRLIVESSEREASVMDTFVRMPTRRRA